MCWFTVLAGNKLIIKGFFFFFFVESIELNKTIGFSIKVSIYYYRFHYSFADYFYVNVFSIRVLNVKGNINVLNFNICTTINCLFQRNYTNKLKSNNKNDLRRY
jgi:hypothetical protein